MRDKLEVKEVLESLGFRQVSGSDTINLKLEMVVDNYRYFCTIMSAQTLQLSVLLYSYSREQEVWDDELFREMYQLINQVNSDSILMKLSEQAGVVRLDYLLNLSPCENLRLKIAKYFSWFILLNVGHLKEKILDRPILRNALGRRAYWGICPPLKRIRQNSEWTDVRQYSEGLIAVADHKGRYGYLDADTKEAVACQWAFAQPFSEGLAAVEDFSGRYGFIDRTGRVVIPCEWTGATWFSEGLAAVMDANGEWGFINSYGRLVIPCTWAEADDFCQSRAFVWDADYAPYVIDRQGHIRTYGQETMELATAVDL